MAVRLRLIHVGLGGWGRDWERNALPLVSEIERVAFVDADPAILEKARETLALPNDRCFASLDAALAVVEADAVLATVPLVAHVPVALAALEAGLHVLVEKPFAATLAEAERVVAAGEAAGRVVMVSQNYRPYPAVRAVIDLLREGSLGPVGAVHVDFRKNRRPTAPLTRPYFRLAQPLLEDMSIHHFDLMRAVLGREPIRVSCEAWNPPWSPFAGPASAAAVITFDGGIVASYRGSWVGSGLETTWGGEWRIECERGEIVWTTREGNNSLAGDRVTVRPLQGPAEEVALPELPAVGRAGVMTAFARAIATGEEPSSSGRDNLGSIALMTATVAAATERRSVAVPVPAALRRASTAKAVGDEAIGTAHAGPRPGAVGGG